MDVLREESVADEYKIFINELGIDIGWGSRLIECDKFTSSMNRRTYFKFSKCREASLTSYRKKFYSWLKCKQYAKVLTYFLGFIAWDRIGCIIQIARKIRGVKYGQIIEEKEDFLTPSEVVQAILFLNALKEITPTALNFVDKSLEKVDTSNIKLIGRDVTIKKEKVKDIKKEPEKKRKTKKKSKDKCAGNKRKHQENEDDPDADTVNKKQRLN